MGARASLLVVPAGLMALGLAACEAAPVPGRAGPGTVEYLGIATRLLDDNLVSLRVALRNPRDRDQIDAYARCAAAQYALIRGFGFARHVRTNLAERDGIWQADAVYTVSSSLPRGPLTLDAEVVVDNCTQEGIPTV